ncbi:MAG: cytochrome c oxidase subunit II [Bacteroidota bacterium]
MNKLLIVLIILLGIIAIAQLMRVYELSSKLRNKREEDISEGDNKLNGTLMLVFMIAFYAFFIWQLAVYGGGELGPSASEHGVSTDWLLLINFYIIITVFFITNTLLFYFAYKYSYKKDRKALYYPHNNKLEMIWTIVPAAVMAVIIILGLKTWNEITAESGSEAVKVEVYAKQFDWTARYSGENNELGHSDFRLVLSGGVPNPLGVLTTPGLDMRISELKMEIDSLERITVKSDSADEFADVLADEKYYLAKSKIDRTKRHLAKIEDLRKNHSAELDTKAFDDKVVKEIYLIKGKEYEFTFRSQDVIHSAYFPHFRAQMNCVPGMTTRFKFIPTITTKEFRELPETIEKMKYVNKYRRAKGILKDADPDIEFDYILLCNKICGAAHSNMQLKVVVVENEDEFKNWWDAQKSIKQAYFPEPEKKEDTNVADTSAANANVAPPVVAINN